MALTYVAGSISGSNSTTDGATVSTSIPAHTAGDLLLLFAKGTGTVGPQPWGTPSGWTALTFTSYATANPSFTGDVFQCQVFWKIGNGSESSVDLTADTGHTGNINYRHHTLVYSGLVGTPTFVVDLETTTGTNVGPSNTNATRSSLALAYTVSFASVGGGGGYDSLNSFTHRTQDTFGNQLPRARVAERTVPAGSVTWPTYTTGLSNEWIFYKLLVQAAKPRRGIGIYR